MEVILEKIESKVWRARLKDADHIGGCGATPEEAIGFLVLNHPQRMGVTCFTWRHKPPKLGHNTYPIGIQESFEHLEK